MEFLDIIKYPNNKAKFIKEFEETNQLEALANTLDKLPEDVQKKIKESKDNLEEIKKYLHHEAYLNEIIKVSHAAFINFVESISPLLNFDQKQKVVNLLKQ